MFDIEELLDEYEEGKLRIDCSQISRDEAARVGELFLTRPNIRVDDGNFDGTAFCEYIMYYKPDYPWLGFNTDHLVMWRIKDSNKHSISVREFISAGDCTVQIDETAFDDLFA